MHSFIAKFHNETIHPAIENINKKLIACS